MVKQLSHKLWCKGMRHHPLLPSNIWYPDLNNSLAFFAFCCAAGFKLRKRQITNEPTGGPGNCPHLVEAVPCDDPSCYNWQLVGLDQCVPDEEKPCGSGTQLAQVGCVNSNGKIWEVKLFEFECMACFLLNLLLTAPPGVELFLSFPFAMRCTSDLVWQILLYIFKVTSPRPSYCSCSTTGGDYSDRTHQLSSQTPLPPPVKPFLL